MNQSSVELDAPIKPHVCAVQDPMATSVCSLDESTGENSLFSQEELSQSNILVLDDEPATTGLITASLNRSGFNRITSFNDAANALESLEDSVPDLIILDINMPDIDGISILKHLRKQKLTEFVPVIVLTSARDDQTRLESLRAGANDFVNKPVNGNELAARVKNAICFRLYAGRIEKQVETVTQELGVDSLTGMNNRRAFDTEFTKLFKAETTDNLSLILFDIDSFKITNDTLGHQAGDEVLKHISKITLECCQQDEMAARIGGDEFAILCTHGDEERPELLAEKIRKRVANEPLNFEGGAICTTISVGISTFSGMVNEKGKLFTSADSALYQSKRQGRNQLNVYSDATPFPEAVEHLQTVPDLSEEAKQLTDTKSAKILIVDDEPTVTQMVKLHLSKADYQNVEVENDALKAIDLIRSWKPDLVILDIRMPGINGLEILKEVRQASGICEIPVLVMTGNDDDRIRVAALKLQANDFLTKPANPAELAARVHNSLLVKFQHDRLNHFTDRLTHEVEVRTNELFATRRETILCMARAGESRDTETGNHVLRVGYYSAVIARQMGFDEDHVGWIELAAQLHDVGKLSIPDAILRKPGKLTDEERAIIETHCENADKIFFGKRMSTKQAVITSPLLKMAARIASSHHERWDGGGYPRGLAGEEIPIEGRICAVCDVFDALSSKRCYKDAFPMEKCFAIITEERGKHFDPAVVDAFIAAKDEILQVKEHWQDTHFAEE